MSSDELNYSIKPDEFGEIRKIEAKSFSSACYLDCYPSNDPNGDAIDRCSNFISDIIDVCRKHRVLIEIDGSTDVDEARFEEQSRCPSGCGYTLGIGDIENNVRLALWNEFHGVESDG